MGLTTIWKTACVVLFLSSLQSSKREERVQACRANVDNASLTLLSVLQSPTAASGSWDTELRDAAALLFFLKCLGGAKFVLCPRPIRIQSRQWVYFDVMFAYPWISL